MRTRAGSVGWDGRSARQRAPTTRGVARAAGAAAITILCVLGLVHVAGIASAQPAEPLPSWNEGAAKKAITEFVARVTTQGGPEFVPVGQRIATFDNDGTLWSEQPIYFQFAFALDRVKALAPKHPEWKEKLPFSAVLRGDLKALAGSRTRKGRASRAPRGGHP